MRILMTGATGFLGRHLARAFVIRGDDVHAVRRAASKVARLGRESDRITWHDVARDPADLMSAASFDIVLHAATHYGRGGANERDVEVVNHDWPLSLLNAAVARGVTHFVNIDTSLPPSLSAYARTKRRFADRAREIALSNGPRLLNVGLESVFGAGDDRSKFQMTLLHALLRDEPSFALTPGGQTRDYVFIDDAIAAILCLVDHAHQAPDRYLAAGVGRGESISIRRFAELMRELSGSGTQLEFGALSYRKGELMDARADTSLLQSLGWAGARSVEQGLRETIERERTGA